MEQLTGALAELSRRIQALGPRPSSLELIRLVETAPLALTDVVPFVRETPQSYHRAPVVVAEHYEILVLTWRAGQGSVPHDHNDSVCVVRVMQGQAMERCFSLGHDGFVEVEYEQVVRAGAVTAFHDASIHSIRNDSADEVLVTLHLYSPPLRGGRYFARRPTSSARAWSGELGRAATIAIVGGGFSGSMIAAHLLRDARAPIRIALIERRGALGEGVAYSTRERAHLLNVPVGNMSAWPDRPTDFATWVALRQGGAQPSEFLPREWYGEYVRDTLLDAARGARARLSIVFDEVRRVVTLPQGGWMLHVARGASLAADAVVLAVGHCPPSDPIGDRWIGSKTRFVTDPWKPFAMSAVRADEPIVVLGSGLTAVDTVLSLSEYSRSAKITLVSANGLIPQGHAEASVLPAELDDAVSRLLDAPGGLTIWRLFRELRARAAEFEQRGLDWRALIDALRPHTASLWRALSARERRRFLARLRPFWEVHRHRTAPSVSARFRELIETRQVEVIAGRIAQVREENGEVQVFVRTRGGKSLRFDAGWVVNCTGPMPSNRPESNPAIAALLAQGWLSLDALALGVETSAEGNAIGANGLPVPDLFVTGTLRKPASWESTAVPELRLQAAGIARRVLDRWDATRA